MARTSARRPKFDLTPISVDEALSNPALAGIESTLRNLAGLQDGTDAAATENVNVVRHIGDSQVGEAPISIKQIGESPIGAVNDRSYTRATKIESLHHPETEYSETVGSVSSAAKEQNLYSHICVHPIGASHIGHYNVEAIEDSHSATEDSDHSIPPIGESHLDTDLSRRGEAVGFGLFPPISYVAGSVSAEQTARYRQKVRPSNDVQDGHSNGEQLLYQALWRIGRPETPETRLVTIGYGGMHDIVKLDRSNCKKNILSLIEKLALETVAHHSVQRNRGKTYRVYSYSAILRRRKQAGMVCVVRTNGVRFVTSDGIPLTVPQPPAVHAKQDPHESPTGDPPLGRHYAIMSDSPIGRSFDTPIAPVGRTHVGPVGEAPTVIQEQETIAKQVLPTTSTLHTVVPQQFAESLHQIVSFIDHQAVQFLWAECRARVADCTVAEVIHFTKVKATVLASGKIQNPIGFLLAAVPKCFEGQTFLAFRRIQRERDEAEAKLRQEREAAQRVAQEEAQREIEAYARAEEELNSMPHNDAELLRENVARDYLKLYPTTRHMPDFDSWIRRMMIRELVKRSEHS